MNQELYQISIVWRDEGDETTIICPQDKIYVIFDTLPLMAIELIKIVQAEEII